MRPVMVGMVAVGLVVAAPAASAQAPTGGPSVAAAGAATVLVMDASGSMASADAGGRTRLAAAKEALRGVVDGLPEGVQVGLRVYGHRVGNADELKEEGCRDTELIAPVEPLDRQRLKEAIGRFEASGYTPIGLSLREAARDLPDVESRTIVLVSDGIDTCAPPDPCRVARDLASEGVDLTVQTVGFQVGAKARGQLECIAEATGGVYRDAPDAGALAEELEALAMRPFRRYLVSGEPVEGTSAVAAAPLLEPGTYTDRWDPAESRFYGFELAAGQRAVVSAVAVDVGGESPVPAGSRGTVRLAEGVVGEDGRARPCGRTQSQRSYLFGGNGTAVLSLVTEEVGAGAGSPCRGIQPRYLELRLNGGDPAAYPPVPVEISVSVVGEPPAASEAATSAPERQPAARAGSQGDGSGSGGVLWTLVLGAVGLGAGFGLGELWGRR